MLSAIEKMRLKSWDQILRSFILPAGDLIYGQQMMKRLKYLEKAQWWDREQIIEERDNLLRDLIQTAYNEVPFYRELMDSVNLVPNDIRKAEDLSKFPIVTKDLLREAGFSKVTRSTGRKTHKVCTSGSTGKNFCVIEDLPTMSWYRASNLLAMEWAGWSIGEAHLQTGIALDRTFDRRIKDVLFRCFYVSAYDLTDASLDSYLNLLEKYNIEHLWGYPGSLYYLAKRAIEKGWNKPLKSIATWGDNLYSYYRKTIEQAFGKKVTDTYGCSEGVQIAAQCEYGTYHYHSLDVIVDYVNDEGEPVPEGQPGNHLITRLYAGPMPIIRYKIGDMGISAKSRECECGRGFEVMDSIQGRDTDVIITPSGNRLIVHFFTGILEHFDEIALFQVVQDTSEYFVLKIVPASNFTKEVQEEIVRQMRGKGGQDINIKFEILDDIPVTSSGKRRFVINELI